MTHAIRQPSALEADQAAVAQVEVLELFAKLEGDGLSWQVTLAGAASAIAAVVEMQAGSAEVPQWFAHMAAVASAQMAPAAPRHDPR